jgi:hypothetical protein
MPEDPTTKNGGGGLSTGRGQSGTDSADSPFFNENSEGGLSTSRGQSGTDSADSLFFSQIPVAPESEKALLSCILLEPLRCLPIIHRHIGEMKRLVGLAGIEPKIIKDRKTGEDKPKDHKPADYKNSCGFFYKADHTLLYEAVHHVFETAGTVDIVILSQHLADTNSLEKVGGAGAVADLLDELPSTSMLHHYLGIVTEKFLQRRAIELSTELRTAALTPGETPDQFTRRIIQFRQTLTNLESASLLRNRTHQIANHTEDTDPANTLNPLPDLLCEINAVPIHQPVYITSANFGGKPEDHFFSVKEISKHTADPRLTEILKDRWIVGILIRDTENTRWEDQTAIENFIKTHLDHIARAGVIKNCGGGLPTGRGQSGTDSADSQFFLGLAETADIPEDILWTENALIFQGANGGRNLREDILARRIVLWKQLLFCGGEFWQWLPAGYWKKLTNSKLYIEKWMRQALRKTEGGLELITTNRINSVKNLIQSTRFIEPEQLNRS